MELRLHCNSYILPVHLPLPEGRPPSPPITPLLSRRPSNNTNASLCQSLQFSRPQFLLRSSRRCGLSIQYYNMGVRLVGTPSLSAGIVVMLGGFSKTLKEVDNPEDEGGDGAADGDCCSLLVHARLVD